MLLMVLLGDMGEVEARFTIVLISTQDWCNVCAERTIGSKSFWTHTMVLLRDVGQVEAHFSPFGESVKLDTRLVHDLHQTHHRLRNQFECT